MPPFPASPLPSLRGPRVPLRLGPPPCERTPSARPRPARLALHAAAWLALTATAVAAPPVPFDPGLEELADRARATGAVRVLVELEPRTAAEPGAADPLAGEGVLARRDFVAIPWAAATLDEAALRRLSEASGVRRVVEDRVVFPQGDLGDAIGAYNLHVDGVDGRGQTIAIVDLGFLQAHAAVTPRIVDQACFSSDDGWSFASLCRDGAPEAFGPGAFASCSGASGCGHGLHVAGIAAMDFVDGSGKRQTGVAPGASIVMVNVFSRLKQSPSCGYQDCVGAFNSDIIRGVEWLLSQAAQHRFAAVNLSLGGDLTSRPCPGDPVGSVLTRLLEQDIPVVVSAGNDGAKDAVTTPACTPGVFAVGATSSTNWGAYFSNAGPLVSLWAPGSGIWSSCGSYSLCQMSGTSMAAPHVAGTLALMRQIWPGASVEELRAGLLDRSLAGWDAYSQPIRVLSLGDIRSSRLVAPPPALSGPRELPPGQSGSFRLAGTTTWYGDPVEYRLEWDTGSGSFGSAWFPQSGDGDAAIPVSFDSPGVHTLRGIARSQANASSVSLWSSPARLLVVPLDPTGPDFESRLTRLRRKCKATSCTFSGTLAITNRGATKSLPSEWQVDTYACAADKSCSPTMLKRGPLGALAVGKTRSYQFKVQLPLNRLGEIVRIVGRADPDNRLVESSEINNEVSAPRP
ncbi:MAG: S8 family serine peptidase [Acidobacteria bacterium]|nr:S8 family serine peptidase [Acidobacteriota bacterium]